MKIVLGQQESEEMFHTALCNGLGYVTSSYGLSLDFSDEEYSEAKSHLEKDNPGIAICFEDVLLEMLRLGHSLTLVDEEGDGDNTSTITINDVHERVEQAPPSRILQMINEEDDADTADVIIQQVFFNEVIFG